MDKRKIVIDCFGCDSPEEVIRGAALAAEKYPGVELILTGEKKSIEDTLGREKSFSRIRIAHAAEVIGNEESPVNAIRRKKDSSLVAALRILKEEEDACAMISAGSTGAVLCGAVMLLGRCEGVERPALASLLPADNGGFVCLADCGANADCRPEQMAAFARHASAYVESLGVKTPRVGLLSVGTEEGKGNALVKETFPLLKESGLHFIGNVEAKSALSGEVDVIVSDEKGENVAVEKVKGRKNSLGRIADLVQGAYEKDPLYGICIGHADCEQDALALRSLIAERLPGAEITVDKIGPIIGASSGPGMLSAYCYAKE